MHEAAWIDLAAVLTGRELRALCVHPESQLSIGNSTFRGQAGFRAGLLASYGDVCAFTGPTPRDALEGAHLYSSAADGHHHDQGGLLMRRDIHRLFDLGHLAIEPMTCRVDVTEVVRAYRLYGDLHGEPLQVDLTKKQRAWIDRHWQIHRP